MQVKASARPSPCPFRVGAQAAVQGGAAFVSGARAHTRPPPPQGLGLYAARDIEKHTMVIEYIGTIIRNEVANRKEKLYESQVRATAVPAAPASATHAAGQGRSGRSCWVRSSGSPRSSPSAFPGGSGSPPTPPPCKWQPTGLWGARGGRGQGAVSSLPAQASRRALDRGRNSPVSSRTAACTCSAWTATT